MEADTGTQRELVLRQAVFELRRNAPKYITFQGHIADDILEAYGSVAFEPGQIRMTEAVRYISDDSTTLASTNGTQSVFYQNPPESIEAFAAAAKAFFKISESRLKPKGYDRVGLLFGFAIPVEGSVLGEWFRSRFGVGDLDGWNADDFSVRVARKTAEGEEYLIARSVYAPVLESGIESMTKYAGYVRVDIDRSFERIPATDLDKVRPLELYEQARMILHEFIGEDA